MREFPLPSLGADMDEGMLVGWLVEPGDEVSRGQIIAEVETDKGIIEVEIWEDAVIAELLVEPGDTHLPVGTPIARIAEPGERISSEAAPEPTVATTGRARGERPRPVAAPGAVSTSPRVTPPVRHLAHQLDVDLSTVPATGRSGTVTREDVRQAAGGNGHRRLGRPMVSPRARKLADERNVDAASLTSSRPDGLVTAADVLAAGPSREPEVLTPAAPAPAERPVDKAEAMRRAIGRSMERSKREIPHYYLSNTIDMARTMAWLDETNEDRPITTQILPAAVLLKASALALTAFPHLNGHWVDGAFTPSDHVHLGVAVALRGGGLVAPAIHDADTRSIDEMMAALSDLVARARAGRLRGSEMSEQTCTVTILGDRGVDNTFPVIIPPQVAIIGFGRIVDSPVAVDGAVTVHPVVQASLAGDHRVTDGHAGGLLLLDIERRLQEPDQL